jgi:hypothetical protein
MIIIIGGPSARHLAFILRFWLLAYRSFKHWEN